ncbi:MAG: hypothetical protein HY728_05715 [Candidatus Rokubacteria bacterium]|nr:hypothetical protein [Candidatus Rokubacteria bacterium]
MSPYAALLSLRRIEEQQAEIGLAEALREVASVERSLAQLRQARAAWLEERADGLTDAMTALEIAERHAARRLAEAQARAATARDALLDRQRQRKVVEQLHLEALAIEARADARRLQTELDELGSRTVRPHSEITE